MAGIEGILEQYRGAAREQVKLPLAVRAYFSGEANQEQTRELERYLKSRVRPMMALLLREGDLPRLEALARVGWLNPGLIEDGLDMAMELKSTEGFVWLLRWKAEHVGFADREFPL